tara:strand:+ start:10175 stop:10480 length:306 start_codon:yes stop_codon:yes gene_type:complete
LRRNLLASFTQLFNDLRTERANGIEESFAFLVGNDRVQIVVDFMTAVRSPADNTRTPFVAMALSIYAMTPARFIVVRFAPDEPNTWDSSSHKKDQDNQDDL